MRHVDQVRGAGYTEQAKPAAATHNPFAALKDLLKRDEPS
jgi:hypothetical protein